MDLNHVEIHVKNGEVYQSRRQSEWEKNLVTNCTQKLLPVQKMGLPSQRYGIFLEGERKTLFKK